LRTEELELLIKELILGTEELELVFEELIEEFKNWNWFF
jgi:hypothetical protein